MTTFPPFLRTHADNLTPKARTPWAGRAIASLKRRYLPSRPWPEAIGESWEVSTDPLFPSRVTGPDDVEVLLTEILKRHSREILGAAFAARFQAFCPILLKWIEADSLLSVQVHPNHDNPMLASDECGKPEAWLVLDAKPDSTMFIGFRDGVSRADAERLARSENFSSLLHVIKPKPFDYIYIPTGCVHALGPGILVAEPQLVLPGKSGKTWRLNDWNRRYDAAGNLSPDGLPRTLHVQEGLSSIDWSLPQGKALEQALLRNLQTEATRATAIANPFRAQIFTKAERERLPPSEKGVFRLLTLWAGKATLATPDARLELRGGESAIIAAEANNVELHLQRDGNDSPAAALFELDPEADLWRS